MFKLSDIIGHQEMIQTLRHAVQRDRVAHAYLFMGPSGIGKATVAESFAGSLLCDEPRDGEACGLCRSCRQQSGGNHPDLYRLRPSGTSIKIEQIRELQRQVQFKPYQSRRQVILMEMVEAMTTEAANCFLKTLEEPVGETVFLLLTNQPQTLLPTILSRCQQLTFRPLSQREVAEGLLKLCHLDSEQAGKLAALTGGSLGLAVRLADGSERWDARNRVLEMVQRFPEMQKAQALSMAEELSSDRAAALESLGLMLLWFRDLLVYHYTSDPGLLMNRDVLDKLVRQSACYAPTGLVAILEDIKQAKDHIEGNANTRLTLEVLMLKIYSYGGSYNVR